VSAHSINGASKSIGSTDDKNPAPITITRTREKRLYYKTLNQKKTPPTLEERWPRRIKDQELDHTNHSHDDTKMPTRSGLSFDPAAFCQAPLDLLDPEPAKPVIPAAEPTGYVSPLYDPAFEVLPLGLATSPGYYSDIVFPPAVQDDLRPRIARYVNDPPYEPADTTVPRSHRSVIRKLLCSWVIPP
jgi:hypothetical protein